MQRLSEDVSHFLRLWSTQTESRTPHWVRNIDCASSHNENRINTTAVPRANMSTAVVERRPARRCIQWHIWHTEHILYHEKNVKPGVPAAGTPGLRFHIFHKKLYFLFLYIYMTGGSYWSYCAYYFTYFTYYAYRFWILDEISQSNISCHIICHILFHILHIDIFVIWYILLYIFYILFVILFDIFMHIALTDILWHIRYIFWHIYLHILLHILHIAKKYIFCIFCILIYISCI